MAYSEDIKKVFHYDGDLLGNHEIRMIDRRLLVLSGHRGLCKLAPDEIILRVTRGKLRVVGSALRLVQAGPSEIYIRGEIALLAYED